MNLPKLNNPEVTVSLGVRPSIVEFVLYVSPLSENKNLLPYVLLPKINDVHYGK